MNSLRAGLALDVPSEVRFGATVTGAPHFFYGTRTHAMHEAFGVRSDDGVALQVVDNVHDGSIIVLHDGNRGIVCDPRRTAPDLCDRAQDVAATREIIEHLKAQGYRFVTVPHLLADSVDATRTLAHSSQ